MEGKYFLSNQMQQYFFFFFNKCFDRKDSPFRAIKIAHLDTLVPFNV